MDWIQGITLGIAIGGFALGVFNTMTNYRRGTERINIEPKFALSRPGSFFDTAAVMIDVKVVNAGHIPVTIREVGLSARRFSQERTRMQSGGRLGEKLPHSLSAGVAGHFVAPWEDNPPMDDVCFAYAVTERGRTFWSKVPLRPEECAKAHAALRTK